MSLFIRGNRVVLFVLVGLLVSAAGVVVFAFDPRTTSIYPPCPFFALTGLLCPGCGTTRALHALLHGHVGEALMLNPLLFLVPPLIAVMQRLPRSRLDPRRRVRLCNAAGWTLLALVLGFWVCRNVPAALFLGS